MEIKEEYIIKKTAPFLVRLEPSLKAAILKRAKRDRISAAALIRNAVRVALADRTA